MDAQTGTKFKKGGGAAPGGQRPRDQKPSWLMPPVQGPNLHYTTFDSKAAGEKVSYLIYLPDYETTKDPRSLWSIGCMVSAVPSRACRACASSSPPAIAREKRRPIIVVFANGMIDSYYVRCCVSQRPVETVIIKELIPHIDATYRTIATREGRMIEGFSMGGYGAGHFGFKYPELFGSISMIDAAVVDLNVMKTRHAEVFQRIFDGKDGTSPPPIRLRSRRKMPRKSKAARSSARPSARLSGRTSRSTRR